MIKRIEKEKGRYVMCSSITVGINDLKTTRVSEFLSGNFLLCLAPIVGIFSTKHRNPILQRIGHKQIYKHTPALYGFVIIIKKMTTIGGFLLMVLFIIHYYSLSLLKL